MSDNQTAAARLAAAWLLSYPDATLLERLDSIAAVVDELPAGTGAPLSAFLAHLSDTPLSEVQAHYVTVFDMKRKACPYLTYWTDGDTRNRGRAILRFKQAYLEAGYDLGSEELPDHLSVVLEFAAIGDTLTGEALLAEHQDAIHLLRDALAKMESAYVHVLDAIVATLPRLTPEIRARMTHIAASGPPVESVGLEPFGVSVTIDPIGARR
ncbi:MAG: nitrate reductase molybdenum cofactor assembly chaperone [Candidatus Nanopelagicales bacterium]|nr:nitrate reductase molybdenum cofactor assembly chaperone [Candidatus Nanopelagicales bacterium]MCF8543268.1 nitrate reductase molybdenum cofactor assembly chaperone [Candidatus Nanopelagicales bacterium]